MGRPPGLGGQGLTLRTFYVGYVEYLAEHVCYLDFFGKQPQSAQLQLLHAKFVQMDYGRGWPVCPVAQPLEMLTVFQLLKPRPPELTWVNFALRCVVLRPFESKWNFHYGLIKGDLMKSNWMKSKMKTRAHSHVTTRFLKRSCEIHPVESGCRLIPGTERIFQNCFKRSSVQTWGIFFAIAK
jgi:hypothetical protein